MPALITKTAAECKRQAAISVENSIREKIGGIATAGSLPKADCSAGLR
jgi:hypothetical protein